MNMCKNSQEMNESLDFVHVNRFNGQLVDKNYPDAVKYARVDKDTIILRKVKASEPSCLGCFFYGQDMFGNYSCNMWGQNIKPPVLRCEVKGDNYIFQRIK